MCACTGLIAAPAMAQRQVMAINGTAMKLVLLNPADGSMINASFISGATGAQAWTTPRDCLQVGSEIWISDQGSGHIWRYSLAGAPLGSVASGINNNRGMELVGNTVYLANFGTGSGAPGQAIIRLNTSGVIQSNFPVSDPFDVLAFNGDLLVSNIATDDIDRYSLAGTFIATWHNSNGTTGINFPEQLARTSTGGVIAAGFSSPAGIYEYNSVGTQVNYFNQGTGGIRGVFELDSMDILYTDDNGIHVYSRAGQSSSNVATGFVGAYINIVVFPAACYANCDGSTAPPILNANDFQCFLNRFAAADSYANCDGSTASPVLNANDFQCFLNAFAAGCS
jgi:hypothetical protein